MCRGRIVGAIVLLDLGEYRMLTIVAVLALMIVVGALLGSTLLSGLAGPWLEGVLACGTLMSYA